jgi:hypothetical protein
MRSNFEEPVDPYRGGRSEPETTPLPRMEVFLPWDYRPDAGWVPEFDLTGYHVEAVDGSIGKVRQSAYATHGSYLAVETGPWIFGRTVIIPAGIVTSIDHGGRRIYLDRSKEQITAAPDYSDEPAYWEKLAAHYGRP